MALNLLTILFGVILEFQTYVVFVLTFLLLTLQEVHVASGPDALHFV
jgi:hypothetical protein